MLNIRYATLTDVPVLYFLIHEMSEYEHLPFLITEQVLASDGFGAQLFVRPQFRKNQIGWALLSRVATLAQQESCIGVMLHVLD
jgi:GNAT superfamily N-acetyltransferase